MSDKLRIVILGIDQPGENNGKQCQHDGCDTDAGRDQALGDQNDISCGDESANERCCDRCQFIGDRGL